MSAGFFGIRLNRTEGEYNPFPLFKAQPENEDQGCAREHECPVNPKIVLNDRTRIPIQRRDREERCEKCAWQENHRH
jgi:hypothetical protein